MRLIDADIIKYDDIPIANARGIVVTRKAVMQRTIELQPTVEIPSFNILQDKTLVIDTDLYPKVGRVFVGHEGLGTFFYSDEYERPKGKWINILEFSGWTCSCCNYKYGNLCDKFCPNCGAEMEAGRKNEI